jgi:Integrase core domain
VPADGPRRDDLVHRQCRPDRRDRLWVQDVTRHRTGEGWAYLAVVIDAWSRRVVGWSIADHMRRARRRRDRHGHPATSTTAGAIAHSDHGSNDCSWMFGQRLRAAACSARWAPSVTPWTTPSPRASSRRCNASSSTATPGRPPRARPGNVPLDRDLPQPDPPPPLHPRLPQPARLRDRRYGMISTHQPAVNRGSLHFVLLVQVRVGWRQSDRVGCREASSLSVGGDVRHEAVEVVEAAGGVVCATG